jgi:hypothetical protein
MHKIIIFVVSFYPIFTAEGEQKLLISSLSHSPVVCLRSIKHIVRSLSFMKIRICLNNQRIDGPLEVAAF